MQLRSMTLACAIAGAAVLYFGPASPGDARAPRATIGAGSTFGPLVGADALDNFHIGGPDRGVFAYRFRAPWTGTVNSVRFFAILNSEERPEGYSAGTGGTFRLSLVTDTGGVRGVPTRHVLAQADYVPANDNLFARLRFPTPARVERGRYYDAVFTNVDSDPVANYASVNTLYLKRSADARPRSLPADVSIVWAQGATDLEAGIRWTRDSAGSVGHSPAVEIVGGAPGQRIGSGYMEVWVGNPKPIGERESVRERFTFARPLPARVGKVWIRLRRTSAGAAPLRLSLETLTGDTIATTVTAASRIPSNHPGWVTASFAAGPPLLRPGQKVALVLRASTARSYEAYPIRDGSMFGFSAATVFEAGYAQFDSGGGWTGWDQWGKYDRHDGDLQFGLSLMPPAR